MNHKTERLKFISAIVLLVMMAVSCGLLKEQVKKMAGIDDEKRERLMKTGVMSKAEVKKVEDTNVTINKNPKVRLFIKVNPESGEPFDAVVEMVVSRVNIPRQGDNVKVWYNPSDKTDIIVE